MKWTVHWSHDAVRQLIEIALRDGRLAKRIVSVVSTLSRGQSVDRKKLKGDTSEWRLRSGDWRILMTLSGEHAYVDSVDNRRDAY